MTIVAAFQLHLAAAPALVEEAPLTPPVAELASRYAIDPVRDPTRFMGEMARSLYALYESRPPDLRVRPGVRAANAPPLPKVPVPLPASVWGSAVFRHIVPADQLVPTILADRRAALLCRGLSGLDDETLQYLIEHPSVISTLYERAPGVFAAFGAVIRVRNGEVVTPGGPEYAALWEALAGAPPARADLFVRALFTEASGRLAYLYDAIDSASPPAARFALGTWMPESARDARLRSLLAAVSIGYREWTIEQHPFTRPLGDLNMLLFRVQLSDSGQLAAPYDRGFWREVFDTDGGELLTDPVDAAWLVWATAGTDMYSRLDRLDQLAFAQRVFANVRGTAGSVEAGVVRPLRRYRMLLLTLERMGVRTPEVYQAVLRRAETLGSMSSDRRFWTIAEFQGTLAFLDRMRRNGGLDDRQVESLVRSLAALPLSGDAYHGLLARWWQSDLARFIPEGASWDQRAIEALAGPVPKTENRLFWEGQMYRIDPAHAERVRLEEVRRRQGGHTFDLAFELSALSEQLRREAVTLADVRAAQDALEAMVNESAARLRNPPVTLPPPGVPVPRDGLVWVREDIQRLARITRQADVRRASAVGESLESLAEMTLGSTLISFAYAAELGDPAGPALLAGNVAVRHDFGLGRKDTETRLRMLWSQPRQEFQPGVPWHLAGSILTLDVGMAALNLRRVSMDRVADAPKLSSIEREALAVSVALLEGARLTDADRDGIAAAIDRGRARAEAVRSEPAGFSALADELGLDGFRRRAATYALARQPDTFLDQFTTVDLMMLGGGKATGMDAWGPAALSSFGCVCTRFVPSRSWHALEGRLQLPLLAATMGDLNLTMAVMLRDLGVPTLLLKHVLTYGMQEMMDELGDRGDWWGISAAARSLERQRVEDYVSATAVVDGPLVPIDDETSSTRDN